LSFQVKTKIQMSSSKTNIVRQVSVHLKQRSLAWIIQIVGKGNHIALNSNVARRIAGDDIDIQNARSRIQRNSSGSSTPPSHRTTRSIDSSQVTNDDSSNIVISVIRQTNVESPVPSDS